MDNLWTQATLGTGYRTKLGKHNKIHNTENQKDEKHGL